MLLLEEDGSVFCVNSCLVSSSCCHGGQRAAGWQSTSGGRKPCASQVLLLPFRASIKELSLKMKAACCWGGSGTSLLCSQSGPEVFPLLLFFPNFWSRDQGDSYNFTIFIYNFLTNICLGGEGSGRVGRSSKLHPNDVSVESGFTFKVAAVMEHSWKWLK